MDMDDKKCMLNDVIAIFNIGLMKMDLNNVYLVVKMNFHINKMKTWKFVVEDVVKINLVHKLKIDGGLNIYVLIIVMKILYG